VLRPSGYYSTSEKKATPEEDTDVRMCLDKRVLAALAAVAVILLAVSPQTLGAAAPILVMAACPLSMLVMMRVMNRRDESAEGASDAQHPSAPLAADADVRQLEEEVNRLRGELRARDEESPTPSLPSR